MRALVGRLSLRSAGYRCPVLPDLLAASRWSLSDFTLCSSSSQSGRADGARPARRWTSGGGVAPSQGDGGELRQAPLKSKAQVPGPRSFPIIGTVHMFLPIIGQYDPQRFMETGVKMHQRYGKITRIVDPADGPLYFLFDPDDIQKVFRHEGKAPLKNFVKGMFEYRQKRNIGTGLFNSNHDYWQRLRRAANFSMLRPRAAANYIPAQASVSRDLIKLMRMLVDEQREVPEYLSILYRWAMESAGVVLFDQRLGTLGRHLTEGSTTAKFADAVNEIFSTIHIFTFRPWPKDKAIKARFIAAMDHLCQVAQENMDVCLEKLAETETEESDTVGVLPALLTRSELSREDVTVLLTDLLFASVDTTAHSVAFALYQLARHPVIQEKLYDEIRQVAPQGCDVTSGVLNDMRYLRAVLKETYRLNPITGLTVRITETDLDLSGYLIPAGSSVAPFFYVPSQLPQYFEKPEEFVPERWLRENVKDVHPFSVLPFSYGARGCVGRRFAEQSIHILLRQIVLNFRVEYHHEDIRLMTRLINMPDKPLRFSFVERQ